MQLERGDSLFQTAISRKERGFYHMKRFISAAIFLLIAVLMVSCTAVAVRNMTDVTPTIAPEFVQDNPETRPTWDDEPVTTNTELDLMEEKPQPAHNTRPSENKTESDVENSVSEPVPEPTCETEPSVAKEAHNKEG